MLHERLITAEPHLEDLGLAEQGGEGRLEIVGRGGQEVLLQPRGLFQRLHPSRFVDERSAFEHDRGLIRQELGQCQVVAREDRLLLGERLEDADPPLARGDGRDEHRADARRPVRARLLGVCPRGVGEERRFLRREFFPRLQKQECGG